MKAENRQSLESKVKELKELRQNIYDYDFNETAIWYISRAIESLERALND